MPAAQELDPIGPGIFLWQVFDPAVKADLFSTALKTPAGTFLVDPVQLGAAATQNLTEHMQVAGIFVTNENHERAAQWFADRFSVPIYRYADLSSRHAPPRAIGLRDQE